MLIIAHFYSEASLLSLYYFANYMNILPSPKKLKEKLDQKIEDLQQPQASSHTATSSSGTASASASAPQCMQCALAPSKGEVDQLYAQLNNCKIKAVAFHLVNIFADQFIDQSCSVPVVSELFHTHNLNLGFSELLVKCIQVQLNILAEQIKLVEETSRAKSKGSGFFKHRAGRIGASISGDVFHTHLSLPSQSLIKTICYPTLYKLNCRQGERQSISLSCVYSSFFV